MGLEKLEEKLDIETQLNKLYGPGSIGITIKDNAFYIKIAGREEEIKMSELNIEEIKRRIENG